MNIPKSTAYRTLKSLTEQGFLVQVSQEARQPQGGDLQPR